MPSVMRLPSSIQALSSRLTRKGVTVNYQIASAKRVFRLGLILSLASALHLAAHPAVYAQAAQAKAQDKPFVVEYYYKVKWGSTDEFIRLYKKNHYPLLKKQTEEGRILQMKTESPFYHANEEGRWDYRVTIAWKNSAVAHDDYDDSVNSKKLFPDQEGFKREEQRRFELLLGHWDVALVPVDMDKP